MNITELAENDPSLQAFIVVAADNPFPIQNLPFGIFKPHVAASPRVGVAIGDHVLDLSVLADAGLFDELALADASVFQQGALNAFLALGKAVWRATRARISQLLREDCAVLRDNATLREQAFYLQQEVQMLLPVNIGGYTDFYSSKEHATNVGTLFRGKENPLMPNWTHMPIGYDGRASSVVVSGTNFHRPCGQIVPKGEEQPRYAASRLLDTELEVGFIIGQSSEFGQQISTAAAEDYVFGLVLLSDWSARDIQKWEYQPLGPFLGKNFCTTISPWIVTLDALQPFRVPGPVLDHEPLAYLQTKQDWGLNLALSMALKSAKMADYMTITQTNFKSIYWNFTQQLAHHAVNGCPMQIGDLFGSGTVSGSEPGSYGSLLELTWAGQQPLQLPSGETRSFLADGDSIKMTGFCQGQGYRVGFGELVGTVLAALN